MSYEIAVIGTGNPEADGYAMAYRHAQAYERLDNCRLRACADIVKENAAAFAREFDIEDVDIYEDYAAMLDETAPDIVSVCTPTPTHAEIVTDCAEHGTLEAIHCEKPMGATWKECREMVSTCDREGVQLTFNHQRRFAAPYRNAKSMLEDGRIGDLRRIEIGGQDLYDYGTHLFDMCGYLTDQTQIEWVFGQVDHGDSEEIYGLYREREALARWRYESGVDGFASTGKAGIVGCEIRIVGEDGTIEVGPNDGPPLRVRDDGSGWEQVDTGRDGVWRSDSHPVDRLLERAPVGPERSFTFSDPPYVGRAIAAVVDAVTTDRRPVLAAGNALQSTEIIFSCWESARRGGRIDLPLDIDDNPLRSMIEAADRDGT